MYSRCRCRLTFSRRRFAFPATMKPPVLARRMTDKILQMVCIPLGQQWDAAELEIWLARIAYRLGADFVMQRRADPPRVADHRRRLVGKRERGHGFVRGGGPAKKV